MEIVISQRKMMVQLIIRHIYLITVTLLTQRFLSLKRSQVRNSKENIYFCIHYLGSNFIFLFSFEDDSILYKLQVEIAEFGKMNVIRLLEQKSIQMLYIRTHPVSLQRNNLIAKEGDKVESIYFVREGEVKLVKKIINENEQIGSSNAVDKTNSFQMQH